MRRSAGWPRWPGVAPSATALPPPPRCCAGSSGSGTPGATFRSSRTIHTGADLLLSSRSPSNTSKTPALLQGGGLRVSASVLGRRSEDEAPGRRFDVVRRIDVADGGRVRVELPPIE